MATIIRDKIKQPDGKDFKLLDAVDIEHKYTTFDENGKEVSHVTSVEDYLNSLTEDVKTNASNIASIVDGTMASFTTDETLTLKDGVLKVNTANAAESDNTLPITSAAVDTIVGNIAVLLETI